ncbi:LysE family translocator [Marinobacteraceae bacterium S3BR75-40.1]
MAFPDWWMFLLAITVLTLTPGVDTLLVVRSTVRGGWLDGCVTSLGICTGLFVHATVSALGLSVLLVNSAWAYTALKMIGAIYLVLLGLSSLWRVRRSHSQWQLAAGGSAGDYRPWRSFREGVMSNVLNPKTVVFYMLFLPQFIDPQGSPLAQSLVLASVHFLLAMVWQCLVAWLVGRAALWLMQARVQRVIEGSTGAVLALLGVKLGLESR